MDSEIDALQVAFDATQVGARGVFFGRNVTQANDPEAFLEALKLVVKKGVMPESAAKQCGI
jgi:DhnA family fructose-bisphosphate aldolase class Ia